MPTKSASSRRVRDDLRKEYELDYAQSRPNRFAAKLVDTTVVVLQPDVAEVFRSSKDVNDLLRSAISATGVRSSRGGRRGRPKASSAEQAPS
jgi:hypothetical protein